MRLILLATAAIPFLAPEGLAQRRIATPEVWQTLAERYDKNKDGKLTQEEYTRGKDKFARWDANKDGVISAADFQAGGDAGRGNRRGGNRGNRGGRRINKTMVFSFAFAMHADKDQDRTVTAAEWKAFCDKLDCDQNDVVTKDELPNAATLRAQMFDRIVAATDTDKDGKMQVQEVRAVFAQLDKDKSNDLSAEAGEFRRIRVGRRGGGGRGGRGNRGNRPLEPGVPRVGDAAPDFDLPLVDQPKDSKSEVTIKLSSFKGKKPVALIFGSYT